MEDYHKENLEKIEESFFSAAKQTELLKDENNCIYRGHWRV